MAEWKRECCSVVQGFFMESLRRLLGALGVSNWFEITAGMSWRQYRALDLYVRVFSGGLRPLAEEAWYLLNIDSSVQYRHKPRPENWYQYTTWTSWGQRPCMTEWKLVNVAALARMPPQQARL